MIPIEKALLLAVTIANLFIGIYVLIRNPKSLSHQAFFMFVIGETLWSSGLLIPLIIPSLLSVPLILYGGVIMILGLTLFSWTFPRFNPATWHWYILVPFGLIFGTIPFGYIIKSATLSPQGFLVPENGIIFPYFAIAISFYMALSIFMFTMNYRKASGTERLQMRYFLTGAALFIILIFVCDVLLPNYGIFSFNLFGPIASIIFLAFTAFAMIKHRLLDLRLVVARAISFFFFLVVIAGIYAGLLFVIAEKVSGIPVNLPFAASMFVFTVLIMLSFQPLQTMTRKMTKRIFFQSLYNPDHLLTQLTRIMATTIELDSMSEQIVNTLIDTVQIEKAALLITEGHKIVSVKGRGYPAKNYAGQDLESLLHGDYPAGYYFLREETKQQSIRELFDRLDISIAMPIQVENAKVALLILGSKSSGEIYYQGDIDFLKIFASEAGIAIQNAKAYEAIRKFNEELEKTVEERTRELKETQARELAKAQDVARLKDEFVFIAAHELRTPVAAIKGLAELIQDSKGRLSKELKHYVDSIYRSSDNLNQLITDLLEIARSDAGAMKIETTSVELVPIIEDVVKEVAPLAAKSKVKISFTPDKMAPTVSADAGKIREVITNLVSNAIKYNRPKGRVDIVTRFERGNFITEVRDTGFGIPQTQQEKIFQKFFRAQTPGTEKVPGTGLGLFLTRMLIERMGGTITFQSTEGVGSSFTFSLPLETSFMPEQIPQKAA